MWPWSGHSPNQTPRRDTVARIPARSSVVMWQYWWAHAIYHVTRWFPRNNRLKIRIVTMTLTFGLLIPQVFILTRPHTERYCGQHLFEMLIVCIIFTFVMIGFSFLFSIMEPVPWEVKLAFHIFGGACFVIGIVITALTSLAGECKVYTEELYWFSVAIAVFSMLTAAFFTVMLPFWLVNRIWPRSVLDLRFRTGFCYEPVKCCSCMWHV